MNKSCFSNSPNISETRRFYEPAINSTSDFGSFDLVSSLVWWKAETNIHSYKPQPAFIKTNKEIKKSVRSYTRKIVPLSVQFVKLRLVCNHLLKLSIHFMIIDFSLFDVKNV